MRTIKEKIEQTNVEIEQAEQRYELRARAELKYAGCPEAAEPRRSQAAEAGGDGGG